MQDRCGLTSDDFLILNIYGYKTTAVEFDRISGEMTDLVSGSAGRDYTVVF